MLQSLLMHTDVNQACIVLREVSQAWDRRDKDTHVPKKRVLWTGSLRASDSSDHTGGTPWTDGLPR